MTFSIVIPTYNGMLFVEKAIQSALAQTRKADEIIISDNNSTDDTLAICKKFKDQIKIYSNPNGPSGFVNGWNNAIQYCTSDYITILHQDDILSPNFLEEIEHALNIYPDVKHLFVPCSNIDENGKVFYTPDYCDGSMIRYTASEYINAYQHIGNPHIHRCPGVVTHRSIFDVCKYRPEAGHIADDDFFYRVGQFTDIVGVLKPLASYRVHQFSETGHLDDMVLDERLLHDYCFQITEIPNNKSLDKNAILYFKYWKWKFFRRLIGYGLKTRNFSVIKYAIAQIL